MRWMDEAPKEIGNESLNGFVVLSYRSFYTISDLLTTLIYGNERKNKSRIFKKIRKGNELISSFFVKIYFYKIMGRLGFKKTMGAIYIPKYDYKVLCPYNVVEYVSLISREENMLSRFNPQPGETVIDVGAHLGRYSIIGSKRVGKDGKVISIEANPDVYPILIKNISLNNLNNVFAFNNAAFSKQTKIKFYKGGSDNMRNNQFGTVITNIDNFNTKGLDAYVEVDAITIDSLLLKQGLDINKISWIKIDVEGAEFEVIEGCKNLLSTSNDLAILVEIHNLSDGTTFYEKIKKYLENNGFLVDFEERRQSGESHVLFKKFGNKTVQSDR
ncbi:MAG: FkbM family methyltransferase [Candidatus Nitrosocosmicus sp.]